jgi:DNA-binding transcriptional regulator GbsR (MarR family)
MTPSHLRGKRKKFVDLIERIMVRWGYNNTEGRIYGILLLSEEPLRISDFLNLTNLSRTSISTSLKRLVNDELVNVRREKKVKYFSPNPIFKEKFMVQPRELLEKEITPILEIIEELRSTATSDDYREKLENIEKNLKELEGLLNAIIEMEKDKKFKQPL